MSCTRGCTGTDICSALNLCCIQFLQDCGKECEGVAEGYSTIQIDVDGNLQVCSNVGGVCECNEICQGICQIVSDNTCDDGGIGADYAVWEADLTNGVLTINGAPEHRSLRRVNNLSRDFPGIPHPANPLGPAVITEVEQINNEFVLTNPSDCREMNLLLVASTGMVIRNYVEPLFFGMRASFFKNGALLGGSFTSLFSESGAIPVNNTRSIYPNTISRLLPGETATFSLTIWSRNGENQDITQIQTASAFKIFGATNL